MDFDTLINRASALLAFMGPKEAAVVLADGGVPPDEAFFALKAAVILVTPAPVPYSNDELEAGHFLADMEADGRLDWFLGEDHGDYMDRGGQVLV